MLCRVYGLCFACALLGKLNSRAMIRRYASDLLEGTAEALATEAEDLALHSAAIGFLVISLPLPPRASDWITGGSLYGE